MMRRTWIMILLSIAMVSAFLGVNSRLEAAEVKTKIIVTGSSTIAPLLAEIGKRYEEANPNIQVDVQTGGSSRGIADLRRGLADIGMVSRRLSKSEEDLKATTIAWDGIAVVLHSSNPTTSLSDEQLRQIYTGAVVNWQDVGPGTGPLTVVNKAEGRSTLELFLDHLDLDVKAVKAHVVIGDNEQAIKLVAGNPLAIAYVSIGTIEYHINAGAPLKAIGLGSIPPSSSNLANGTYVASRPLNVVTNVEVRPEVIRFIEFAAGSGVHDLIREQYFTPNSE